MVPDRPNGPGSTRLRGHTPGSDKPLIGDSGIVPVLRA